MQFIQPERNGIVSTVNQCVACRRSGGQLDTGGGGQCRPELGARVCCAVCVQALGQALGQALTASAWSRYPLWPINLEEGAQPRGRRRCTSSSADAQDNRKRESNDGWMWNYWLSDSEASGSAEAKHVVCLSVCVHDNFRTY